MSVFPYWWASVFWAQKLIFREFAHTGQGWRKVFYETKCVTTIWFSEEEKEKTKVDTWDSSVGG